MTDSRRLLILKALKTKLVAMDTPAFTFKFSSVELGPLGPSDAKKHYMCGIVAGDEKKGVKVFPLTDCFLPITVEVRMTINQGDLPPAEEVERVLADVQTCVTSDRTLGGLSINCWENGNSVDLDTYSDKTVMAAVFLEVQYRHAIGNPRAAA